MKNQLDSIEEIMLMGPGPSCVSPEVYQALSKPTIGHLDPKFISIMDEIKQLLRQLMKTRNRLPMLNAVKVPDGVDEAVVRKQLLDEHKIEIGAGLGPLADKIWRIGIMGHTAGKENIDRLMTALRSVLKS